MGRSVGQRFAVRDLLRRIAVQGVAGVVAGILVAGIGGRILMRASAAAAAGARGRRQQSWWLNRNGFILRAAVYFLIWMVPMWVLNRLSLRQDEATDNRTFRRMQAIAAPALGFYCLAATFASVDWLMSLDPHWYSSLWGVNFIGGHAVSAFAFIIPVALYLARRKPMDDQFQPGHFHDYGKLLLAFVMLWTYFQLSQLIIIWSGNLPEEITWYMDRSSQGWQLLSLALILGHFALPFLLLLSAELKKKPQLLALVALWVLAMRWLDFFWSTMSSRVSSCWRFCAAWAFEP